MDGLLVKVSTHMEAHDVPGERVAHVVLTNQSPVVYKTIDNLESQQSPPSDINNLSVMEIHDHMMDQFYLKRFVVREPFKFWTGMDRKAGETVHEIAARIRQDVTCTVPSIKDPLHKALRTRFL